MSIASGSAECWNGDAWWKPEGFDDVVGAERLASQAFSAILS